MLKTILNILGIKIKNPSLMEYLSMMISGCIFIGIGLYLGQFGWMLFGFSNVLIYLFALLYAYKTKKKHPVFDILWTMTIMIATISLFVHFINENIYMEIFSIIVVILSSYSMYIQIKKAYNK